MPARMTDEEKIARFWERVIKLDNGCWEWSGPRNSEGYGDSDFHGKRHTVHRIAWLLTNGPIPAGLWVLHKCDNRPCCNPAHLFLGTRADNVADMMQKGRGTRGKTHEHIRRLRGDHEYIDRKNGARIRTLRRALDLSQTELALKANTHSKYIALIEQGRRNPGADVLTRIAAALNTTVEALQEPPVVIVDGEH